MTKEKSRSDPPQKPDPNECCASGCVPCIYDYYYDQLDKWERENGPLTDGVKPSNRTEKPLKPHGN
ncbi:hypothetical protein NBRC116583_29850 [Arenicella sp. 4NH20-0111]|uniref:oxidoreductase-like domain-containing protein n=1 Tax=Arenicella sp. 4NH20-0111 TaxID=3127648 RepID=UPI003109E09C